MRRYAIALLVALGALLVSTPLLTDQASRSADFDANGIVDFGDFILFAQAFGSDQSGFDLDGNGNVDFPDFILFAKQFGEGRTRKEYCGNPSRRREAGNGLDPTRQVPDGIARFRDRSA